MLKKIFEFVKPEEHVSPSSFKEYLALDIEITKIIPEGARDWNAFRPFGISCAATLTSNGNQKVWYGKAEEGEIADQMSQNEVAALVGYLSAEVIAGKSIVTWNGLFFDFDVLAEESGLYDACKNLSLGHIDMMFHLFCQKGYPLGLDKAAKGMGLSGKPTSINGALAPKYWSEGRREDVLNYVLQDAKTTLDLFLVTEKGKQLRWQSNKNQPQTLPLPHGWLTVNKAMVLPLPDTSWMKDPWTRKKFTEWLTLPERKSVQGNQPKGANGTSTPVKSLSPSYTHVFYQRSDLWWKIKTPTVEDENAISQFLTAEYALKRGQNKQIAIDLAMREIAITFGGTNIAFKGSPTLKATASIEDVEAFLRKIPQEMTMEVWHAIGNMCPGWGPDGYECKEEKEDNENLSEASVGLGDYISPDYDDDYWPLDEEF